MSNQKSKSDQDASAASVKPQPRVHLEFVGIDKGTDTGIPKVQLLASVENASDDTIKLLRWNSVLDPQAGLLGAISLRNQHTAKAIEIPTIMINRQTPPQMRNLEDGADYEAMAQGRFMEIWRGDQHSDPASYSSDAVRFKA